MNTWLVGGKNAGYAGAAERLRLLGMENVRTPLDVYTPERTDRQAIDAELAELRAAELVVLLPGWDADEAGTLASMIAGAHDIPQLEYLDLVADLER